MNTAPFCCCEPGTIEECPVSSCPCASSYTVNNISVSYGFQLSTSSSNCPNCGQGGCGKTDYAITVTGVQLGPLVVTRGGGTGEQLPCCYYGEGEMRITYSFTFQQARMCSGLLNRTCDAQTFTGTIDVPISMSVTCRSTGTVAGCNRNLGVSRAYFHKLQICNWPLRCSDVMLCGAIDAVTGDCVPDFSCDNLGANCDNYGPFSLWCGGALITRISRYQCLDTLLPDDFAFRGFHGGGPLCGDGIEPFHLSRTEADGPFAMYLREECDAGGADPCDQNFSGGGTGFVTLLYPQTSSVYNDLRGFCASVDASISTPCNTTDIIQAGGVGIGWSYA